MWQSRVEIEHYSVVHVMHAGYVAVPGRNRTLLCCTYDACWICMWQSRVEIEHYSVVHVMHAGYVCGSPG